MSQQINLHEIIQQQQKQLAAMQVQIQALLAAGGGGIGGAMGSNTGPSMEVAKLAIFNGEAGKVGGFIMEEKQFLDGWHPEKLISKKQNRMVEYQNE